MKKLTSSTVYDVGLSFAGANRPEIEKIDAALKLLGVSTFLDSDNKPRLAGEELTELLPDIYKNECLLYTPLISKDFVESVWANREKRAALERALKQDGYVIPIRLDDTEVPGLSSATGFLDAKRNSTNEIADVIATKLLHQRAGMQLSDKRRVSDFKHTPVVLSSGSTNMPCPLGQAHLIIGCENAMRELFDLMHTAWIQNPSNTKYEDDQPFPSQDGLTLISKLCSSWPTYDLQISFIDDQLSVYAHIDLSAGFNLLNSNLPMGVKAHFEKWRLERETGVEDAEEDVQFFSWFVMDPKTWTTG